MKTLLLPLLSAIVAGCAWLYVGSAAQAQAVQLPTIQQTGVITSVLVPDGGATMLGGVSHSSYGSTSRGVPGLSKIPGVGRAFGNRAIGSSTSTSTLSVSVKIHDLHEMDEQLLAEAAGRRTVVDPRVAAADAKADFITRNVGRRAVENEGPRFAESSPSKIPSVAEIRRDNELAIARQNEEAEALLEKGRSAELDGHRGSAKVFYAMAARRATGTLKATVQQRLAALSMLEKSDKLATGQ